MIQFKHVSFSYTGEEKSLKDVSCSFEEGRITLICGPSGCGKTTMIRCVNGLIPHFYKGKLEGEVLINGWHTSDTPLQKLSHHVGSVFQNPRSQFFNVDTTSEIAFGCENFGMPPEEIIRRIEEVVKQTGLQDLMDRNIFQLSGGEKQKIACAGVAAQEPEVITLDEPSANLDYKGVCHLQKMLALWKKQKKTVLIAEHRIAYLLPYIDQVLVMEDGEIRETYTGEAFSLLSEEELHKRGLRGKTFENAVTMELPPVKDNKDRMVLNDLRFGYPGESMLLDIPGLELPKGEIIAVVGANGRGKTTFLRCLCGMEKRCKAMLTYNGQSWNRKQRLKHLYMVMQDVNHQLFTDSVLEEVMISQEREDKEKAMEILRLLDLEDVAMRHPLSLSGGQKQRVAVASALASKREILLFDEPTSGLDHRHMLQVADILKQLKEQGKTVILVTHDGELLKQVCTVKISLDAKKETQCQEIKHSVIRKYCRLPKPNSCG
ncbi:MAG: ABC transporter ATP-binding protein [Lachnospiraceae bacterium]|nr:ABC transporter ATP-binding protein [Lachnospiraceae bacterium]